MDNISIAYVGFRRDLRNRLSSIRVKVMYEIGEFELAFQIDRVPIEKEELDAMLRKLIADFAGDLQKAAQRPIEIPRIRPSKI